MRNEELHNQSFFEPKRTTRCGAEMGSTVIKNQNKKEYGEWCLVNRSASEEVRAYFLYVTMRERNGRLE